MKRVALISEHASPLACLGGVDSGGQNVYVGQVAKHLAARGYRVDVYTRRDSAELPEVVECPDGTRVINVPAGPPTRVRKEELLPFMEAFADYLVGRCWREGAYDVIHANFFMSALVACEAKRWLGTPFVVTFHALGKVRRLHQKEADAFPEERLAIEARAVAEADCVIAECPQDREDLQKLYGADARRIRTIPCGFDPDEFGPLDRAAARAELGIPASERVVLQLGRMVPRKGVDNVIRGVARLRRDHNVPARLLVVGGETREPDPKATPEIGRLMGVAESEGATDLVTFVGSRGRQELKLYYAAADVFVTTPWYEPFGITPVEAMACGVPVIGAEVGGIKYSVRDGETGFLVPPNDPAALAERLAKLFRDPLLRRDLGIGARRRALTYFTWKRVAASVARLYEDVLAARRPAAPAPVSGPASAALAPLPSEFTAS